MLVQDYSTSFRKYVSREQLDDANDILLAELGKTLVAQKQDFIDLLNENEIEADKSMSDIELVEKFVDNAEDKELLLGASLLLQTHNAKKSSFDGDDELDDDEVKLGYAVLDTYFNFDDEDDLTDEKYSYIAPALIGGLFRGAKNLLQRRRDKRQDRTSSREQERLLAQQQMIAAARAERERQLAEQRRIIEENKRRRRRTTTIVVVSSIAVVSIVATILILRRRKR